MYTVHVHVITQLLFHFHDSSITVPYYQITTAKIYITVGTFNPYRSYLLNYYTYMYIADIISHTL